MIYGQVLEQSHQSVLNKKIKKKLQILHIFAQKQPTLVCPKHCLYAKLLQ